MKPHVFRFCDTLCHALPSGALWLPDHAVLCVSDLHLGKSDRIARRTGAMLPPYDVADTLQKLADDLAKTDARQVICLGDSFDDLTAADNLDINARLQLSRFQAGRDWYWIEGNHDPGPVDLGGNHLAQVQIGPLIFRHIATPARAEISGHYHPKFRLAGRSRPCFVFDADRMILPAYGTYTGGLDALTPVIRDQFGARALVIATGRTCVVAPLR
jgi:uncharacterized protein